MFPDCNLGSKFFLEAGRRRRKFSHVHQSQQIMQTVCGCQLLQSLPWLQRAALPKVILFPRELTHGNLVKKSKRANSILTYDNSDVQSLQQSSLQGQLKFCWVCVSFLFLPLPSFASFTFPSQLLIPNEYNIPQTSSQCLLSENQN